MSLRMHERKAYCCHIWKQLASKDTLFAVPCVRGGQFIASRQSIQVIKLVDVRSADPSKRRASRGLLSELSLIVGPLPCDAVFVRSLYGSSSHQDSLVNLLRKSLLHSVIQGSPVACLVQIRSLILDHLDLISNPNVAGLEPSAFSAHK